MISPGAGVLPHGPAMRLVVSIENVGADNITCCCRIPSRFPWAGSGALPVYLALEGVAQAAGLLVARQESGESTPAGPGNDPLRGYLVRIRNAEFSCTELNPHDSWTTTAEITGRSGGIVICRGEAWQARTRLLQSRFALYLEGFGQSR